MMRFNYKPYDPYEFVNEIRRVVRDNSRLGVLENINFEVYQKVDPIYLIWLTLNNDYEIQST